MKGKDLSHLVPQGAEGWLGLAGDAAPSVNGKEISQLVLQGAEGQSAVQHHLHGEKKYVTNQGCSAQNEYNSGKILT